MQIRLTVGFAAIMFATLLPQKAYADCVGPAGKEGEYIYNYDYKTMQFCDGTNWISMAGGSGGSGSGITDGNKGDITVSGAGATWTINGAAVQYSKIQNVGAGALLGRYTATSGTAQEITLGSGLSLNTTTGVLSATGSLSGSGATGYVPYWSSATALSYDNTSGGQFFWDATNHRLGIGLATPTQALDVNGKITTNSLVMKQVNGAAPPVSGSSSVGSVIEVMTTTQRDAITSPATGMVIYNTTTSQLESYNGAAWVGVGGSAPHAEVILAACSGFGSTNTKVPRFSSVVTNTPGGALTYTDSAVSGTQITIGISGTYYVGLIGQSAWNGGSGNTIAVLKNSTTSPSMTSADTLFLYYHYDNQSSSNVGTSATVYLTAGDVLYPYMSYCFAATRFEVRRIN